jgi:hypothetical protein
MFHCLWNGEDDIAGVVDFDDTTFPELEDSISTHDKSVVMLFELTKESGNWILRSPTVIAGGMSGLSLLGAA